MKFKIKYFKNKLKKLNNKKSSKPHSNKQNSKMNKMNKRRNQIKIKILIDTYNNLTHTTTDKAIILIIKMKKMLVMFLFNLIEFCN